jgi:hypothetical protein
VISTHPVNATVTHSRGVLVLRSRCHVAECSSVFRIPDSVFPFMCK